MLENPTKFFGMLTVALVLTPAIMRTPTLARAESLADPGAGVTATSPPEAAKGLAETGGGAGAKLPNENAQVAPATDQGEAAGVPEKSARPPSATGAPAEGLPEAKPGHVVPSQDANFLVKAANIGQAEVELARLALERATSEPVKEHAKRMLEEHRQANEKLNEIASGKNFPLPDQLTGVHRNLVQELRDEKPADFDEAYMQAQVGEHKAAVALFRDEKNEGKDPQLREFAGNQLPTLEQHLENALTIAQNIVAGGRDKEIPHPAGAAPHAQPGQAAQPAQPAGTATDAGTEAKD